MFLDMMKKEKGDNYQRLKTRVQLEYFKHEPDQSTKDRILKKKKQAI